MVVILATITNTRPKLPSSPPLQVKGLVETAAAAAVPGGAMDGAFASHVTA
jgi:hypothetical protein